MPALVSKDGTKIAYDKLGEGPALIVINGALTARGAVGSLAELLSPHFTVYCYDRRGKGDSGDTPPYSAFAANPGTRRSARSGREIRS